LDEHDYRCAPKARGRSARRHRSGRGTRRRTHERASGSSLASGRHEIVTSHIDSVVSAIVLALDHGEARRRYYMFDDADPAWPSMTTSTRGQ